VIKFSNFHLIFSSKFHLIFPKNNRKARY